MDPYKVVQDTEGCPGCGRGATWTVKGPDGICIGTSFGEREDAEDLAKLMSTAHERGRVYGVEGS